MKIKSFSFEEKIDFFRKNQWGAEADYNSFYRADSFPERHLVQNLTNDELIAKYFEWIDSHMDAKDEKYLGGYALHCRFEMGRRLREGVEKFDPGMRQLTAAPTSALANNDELINRAIPTFTTALRNRFNEWHDEIQQKIADAVRPIKYPVILSDIVVHPSQAIFPPHAEAVGEDFLNEFRLVIEMHCNFLSGDAKRAFHKIFNMHYNAIIDRTETAIRNQAQDKGVKQPEQFIADMRTVYDDARIKYRMLLDERILKHNLKYSPVGTDAPLPDAQTKKFSHGELKKKIEAFLERDACVSGETVPSAKIAKWVREMMSEGYATSESSVRAKLSNMGYSTEKT